MDPLAAQPPARIGARLVLDLFKLRIGVVIGITAAAGAAVTPGPWPGAGALIVLVLAVTAAAAAAGGFNQYYERDLDRLMSRTRSRAFAAGTLMPSRAFLGLLGVVLLASVAAAAAVANTLAAVYVFLGAFVYAIVYTAWLKRRTWANIVVGGLAGSFAVLAGAAAVTPSELAPAPALLAAVLFLWTPPHFWSLAIACRDDYTRAGVPMLPVLIGDARCARVILGHTVALSLLALVPLGYGMGPVYGIGAIAGGALFITTSVRLVLRPGAHEARVNFHASLAQLSLLLLAALVDRALA
ncbi:MAG: protoheme IX farnesyltransferase [Burkholderiales bacterium]|nr:protoheme IX farnesyltransferase [Burkholderiales bacterium]